MDLRLFASHRHPIKVELNEAPTSGATSPLLPGPKTLAKNWLASQAEPRHAKIKQAVATTTYLYANQSPTCTGRNARDFAFCEVVAENSVTA
jgi:hypothetical protein